MERDIIVHGDCAEVMAEWPDDVIDLTVTSPPYDNMREYKGFNLDIEAIARELYRITKPGGICVWIVTDATIDGDESCTSMKTALTFREKAGWKLFDTMIYSKNVRAAVGNNKGYWQAWEYMFVFTKGMIGTTNLLKDRKNTNSSGPSSKRMPDGRLQRITNRVQCDEYGRRSNVWIYMTGRAHSSKDDIAYEHPAIFPEQLAEDHIRSWSNPGDLILDPFCGSGTVPKAARKNGRHYLGIDIAEEYCELSRRRVNLTGGTQILLDADEGGA